MAKDCQSNISLTEKVSIHKLKEGQRFFVEFVYDGKADNGTVRAYSVIQDFEKSFSRFHAESKVTLIHGDEK